MTLPQATPELPPFYYLHNFQRVLDWVAQRYADLLSPEEARFINDFQRVPHAAQALLVRMVMRKGQHFRASKLRYPEIGNTASAAKGLLAQGWLTANPEVSLPDLAQQLTRAELAEHFNSDLSHLSRAKKAEMVTALANQYPQAQPWHVWVPRLNDPLYQLRVMAHCDRFRLMFFGNLHQEWSTFILAEMGLFRYETVAFTAQSRPFNHRTEVSTYLQLHACREALAQGTDIDVVLADVPAALPSNVWLTQRRDRLLYHIAYTLERTERADQALALYAGIQHPGARLRSLRILEKQGDYATALTRLRHAQLNPESEAERQLMARLQPRLHRQLGLPKPIQPKSPAVNEHRLTLPNDGRRVEAQVVGHLTSNQAPVYYVENALINSLLGLLCWPVMFANLPNAFFHPYQSGPADLNRPDFYRRRQVQFDQALAQLDTSEYTRTIRRTYQEKFGLMSPFVHWVTVPKPLLEHALECLPAAHLKAMFQRILFDVGANRSGLPDLIQFYPETGDQPAIHPARPVRYRMIEVKGPGDRLQDNQKRWLAFAAAHGIAVDVIHVHWQ